MADIFSGESHFRSREAATTRPPDKPAPNVTPQSLETGAPTASQRTNLPTVTPPPDPNASDPNRGFDLGPVHMGFTNRGTPGVSWSGNSWFPSSQTTHNVQDRLTNNSLYNAADPITSAVGGGDLPTLRAQRQAMDAQMSPAAKATADIGAQFMPQNILLNRFGGPAAQGAVQQGLSSFNAGNDLSTAGKDAVIGGAIGKGAQLAGGALNPANVGWAAGKAVENAPALVGLKFGGFGGGWAADKFSKGIVEPAAKRTEEAFKNYMPDLSAYAPALQSAVIGGGQTALDTDGGNVARQNARSYLSPDWSAAGTALQNLRGMLPF